MKLNALFAAALMATSLSLPAYAASAPQAATSTTSADANTDEAIANLRTHMKAAQELWGKIKGLKAKGKNASKAEVEKARASLERFKGMLAEAKREGKAAKMLALSALVNKMEKDLNKIDPMGAKPQATPST